MMPQVLAHPTAGPEAVPGAEKHRPWLPPWMVFGGTPGRPQHPPVEPEPSPPVNIDVPAIMGTAQAGQTLNCTMGNWEYEPDEYLYQWKRGPTIVGSQDFYQCVTADVGNTLICSVTAINSAGSTTVDSLPTATVLPGAPFNVIAPVVSSPSLSVASGDSATTTNGNWNSGPTNYTYQWLRDGSPIFNSTNQTHALVAADEGFHLSCMVTASNTGGSGNATSNSIGPVIA
jgi:hypothetical protein